MRRNHCSNKELSKATGLVKDNEVRMKLLLADLAHEFKIPLGIVSGYVEVMRLSVMEKSADYYYDIIDHDLAQLTDMVNEAIELTMLQSGNWCINCGDHYFSAIAASALTRFEKKLANQGFTVKEDIEDALVFADAHRISQVITNFLSNVMKYCGENQIIELTSSTRNWMLYIAVGNSGNIAEGQEKIIWNRNYHVNQGASPPAQPRNRPRFCQKHTACP